MRIPEIQENSQLYKFITATDRQERIEAAQRVTGYIQTTKSLNSLLQNLDKSYFQFLKSQYCFLRDTFKFSHRADPRYTSDKAFSSSSGLSTDQLKQRINVILEFRVQELQQQEIEYHKQVSEYDILSFSTYKHNEKIKE